MSFKSDMVEIDSDAAGQSNGHADMSSHDHSMARRDNSPPTTLWLFDAFLHVDDRYERIAAGSPRSGIGILGLRLLEHHINLIPTMRHGVAVPMFDHSAGNPRYLGWRQKVATWLLSKQEAMSNRVFVV